MAVYVAVMRNASITNRNGFMSLLKIYRETDAVHEKERILRTIASSPNLELVEEVLNFLISDEVRDQDIVCGFAGISLEGCEIAWRWLKVCSSLQNWFKVINALFFKPQLLI
ncbi:aminopeptidase M1-like [Durio zibethinus]|uniref:Aminopeptidase M1-like n=1 Tax=Durio zibethinus TaxID=66656 RepID=A0A6P5WGZ1_DURZI|nr:aminopeptidase M1-like [Durio zibethinus]